MSTALWEFVVQCFAVCLAIATGIVLTTVAIQLFQRLLRRRAHGVEVTAITEFIPSGKAVDVLINNGTRYAGVTFIGFTDISDQAVPYALRQWVVLQCPEGRVFVKPESIKLMREIDRPEPTP